LLAELIGLKTGHNATAWRKESWQDILLGYEAIALRLDFFI
jgi:hypothetical protein